MVISPLIRPEFGSENLEKWGFTHLFGFSGGETSRNGRSTRSIASLTSKNGFSVFIFFMMVGKIA